MKVKVSEASGPVLDWMVALALGHKTFPEGHLNVGCFGPLFGKSHKAPAIGLVKAKFSTDWSQGGPIISENHIGLDSPLNQLTMFWVASMRIGNHKAWDHDPLIAAMRCYVISELGDEVEVPEELLS